MKPIITLIALCSLGIALHAKVHGLEEKYCAKIDKYFDTEEECTKQCPSGCSLLKIYSGPGLVCVGPNCTKQVLD